MSREFKLPDLGEGIRESEIISVLVSEGDQVEEDQPILEVETDKATVEIPSRYSGTVAEIRVQEGDLVEVGDVLMVFEHAEVADEDGKPGGDGRALKEKKAEKEAQPTEESEKRQQPQARAQQREGPVPASPATRKLARELDVDLNAVPGSGPGGRVTSKDVRSYADGEVEEREQAPEKPEEKERAEAPKEKKPAVSRQEISPIRASALPVPELPDFSRWGEVESQPLRSVRRSTAKQMALAWSQIPHVSHHDVADVTSLESFRQKYKEQIEEQGGSLTLTIFVIKAAVAALKENPRFNASLDADNQELIIKKYYHIGVAVDTDRGLLVPVIRDADRKSITELSIELNDLVERTRAGEIEIDEMKGGSFTITNPGPLGGTGFSPIINYPEAAILGMAQTRWQPVVQGEGEQAEISPRYMLPLVITFDHRVADGADAARYLSSVVEILQDPDKLMVMI